MSDAVFYLEGGRGVPFISRRIRTFFDAEVTTAQPMGELVVTLSPHHPLLDQVLLKRMIEAALRTGHSFKATDAIPGTAAIQVGSGEPREYFSTMQNRYCTNFGIGRPNRKKIFDRLAVLFPDMADWPLNRFLGFIESEEGVDFVVAYGEPVQLEKYSSCPACDESVLPLHSGTNHPITGFLTKNVSIYSHCISCGLTFLNRQMPKGELWRYYQEHSYANPQTEAEAQEFLDSISEATVSHFENYLAALPYVKELGEGARIGDLGAGRGEFAFVAKQANPAAEVLAYEWRFPAVLSAELNSRGVKTCIGDFAEMLPSAEPFQMLTAWEVLEHLKVEDLRPLFATVRTSLHEGGLFIFSTPDFNNRYTRALDFWAAAPGEHITVLSRRFLEPMLEQAGLRIIEEKHESVTLKRPSDWFAFGAETDVHFSSKAASSLINDLLCDNELREKFRRTARMKNFGSELILVCRAI